MNEITQFIISYSVIFFWSKIAEKYNLKYVNYSSDYDINVPCLFVGNYRQRDEDKILNHKGFKVLLWGGTDITKEGRIDNLKGKSIFHIAQSRWQADVLNEAGVKYVYLPMFFGNIDYWKPEILGNKIYVYGHGEKYGIPMIKRIMELVPFEFILTNYRSHYDEAQLYDLYKKCFVGLRLTKFDGTAHSVQEMGLMGRRTIWNGKTPSAISWENIDNIIKTINEESKKIGTLQFQIAKDTYDFLNIGIDWLNVNFYKENL